MIDFRTIVIDNRHEFERLIRQNLNDGYKMVNSNLCIQRPVESFTAINKVLGNPCYDFIYYAYME